MGLAGSIFNHGDRVVVTLDGKELTGWLYESSMENQGLSRFIALGGGTIYLNPSASFIKRAEPTNQELWDKINPGESFTLSDGAQRVKVTDEEYVIVGDSHFYTFSAYDKPHPYND